MVNILKAKVPARELDELFGNILQEALIMNKTKSGNIQILNKAEHSLEIVASVGLSKHFLDHFKSVVADDGSACGRALENGKTIFIPDLAADKLFAPHLNFAKREGIRGVQSTPLISASGRIIGMISTHFKLPRKPLGNELTGFENYCRLAADKIEHLLN